jgi:outer membrane protein
MNRSVLARTGVVAALMAAGCTFSPLVAAAGDTLSLKIASALRERTFWNAGAIHVNVKTKSGDTYDVDGPNGKVVTIDDLRRVNQASDTTIRDYLVSRGVAANTANTIANSFKNPGQGLQLLINDMEALGLDALGTPTGIKGEAQKQMSTGGLSLGYYLDDEHTWAVETYVLAAPLSTSVVAKGPSRYAIDNSPDAVNPGVEELREFGLQGKKILSSKLLPPTVMFGKYWGDRTSKLRPYTGLLAMYAIFYDTKADESLNTYVGGANPGDTTVSLRNAFGIGPSIGFRYQFDDEWRVNFMFGSVKLRTEATLTTRNTRITGATPAVADYGNLAEGLANNITGTLSTAEGTYGVQGSLPGGAAINRQTVTNLGGITAITTAAIQRAKGNQAGVYVRKAETVLTNSIFMLSVGRDF